MGAYIAYGSSVMDELFRFAAKLRYLTNHYQPEKTLTKPEQSKAKQIKSNYTTLQPIHTCHYTLPTWPHAAV